MMVSRFGMCRLRVCCGFCRDHKLSTVERSLLEPFFGEKVTLGNI